MKEVYDEAGINAAICAKMDEPPKSISLKVIPTTEQLEALKLHTRQMKVNTNFTMHSSSVGSFSNIDYFRIFTHVGLDSSEIWN
jgi:hypothetical protein